MLQLLVFVCVCVCGDVLPHYTMHTWHVCIWANVSVETAVCMVHCGGRVPRDVLAVTSTTGDTPPPGVPLCKPETLSIGTPIYVCYRTKNTPCLFTNVSFEKKKVVIFKWRVTGNSGNIQQTLMTCNKWFSQPGIEPGTNCSGLFYNLNDICI